MANEFQLVEPEYFRVAKHVSVDGTYKINDISPTVIKSGDIVTISYSASAPDHSDWIGAYSPPDVDFTTTVPIKYGWCDDDKSYLSTGNGQLVFNLTNTRDDIVFYYFKGSTGKNAVQVAKSDSLVTFKNKNEQLRPRVVPTGDPDVFKLLWSSATSAKPTLRWGTAPAEYTNVVTASTRFRAHF